VLLEPLDTEQLGANRLARVGQGIGRAQAAEEIENRDASDLACAGWIGDSGRANQRSRFVKNARMSSTA
jgi:hypothetical protein